MNWIVLLCLGLGGVVPPGPWSDDDVDDVKVLFDGKTLDGWVQHGGQASFRVEDGCIVGEVGPGPNSFLCTTKTYGDFDLTLEFRIDETCNSGIQIRSHVREKADRVFGYQCEIDPSERSWTGGIFDEGRRGWIDPLEGDDAARAALRREDWNTMRILAVGPHLRTWVNGVPCADHLDPMDLEGIIALQVHNGSSGRLRWRNLKLKDLGRSEWKPLIGDSLAGWQRRGGGEWTLEDGVLRGRSSKDESQHGHLATEKTYDDFAIRLQYRAHQGNSGLYFRAELTDGNPGIRGFQAEIDPEKDAGGLYETGGRGWVVKPSPEQVAKWYRPNAWNEMSVIALGDRVAVHVNGHLTAELKNDSGRRSGHIALQLHGGQDMDIEIRDIEVLPLSKHRD